MLSTSLPNRNGTYIAAIHEQAERAMKLAIPCIALFPYTDPALRSEDGIKAKLAG